MKITKRQLRRIIKETYTPADLYRQLNAVISDLLATGQSAYEVAAELRGIADDVEDNAPEQW